MFFAAWEDDKQDDKQDDNLLLHTSHVKWVQFAVKDCRYHGHVYFPCQDVTVLSLALLKSRSPNYVEFNVYVNLNSSMYPGFWLRSHFPQLGVTTI